MPQRREHDAPLVSVIIPTYNHGRYVGDAIRSVLAQHYRHYEVVVVDDGSTDESRDVVARCGGPVRYIYQQNAGLSAARNRGIASSTGSLIGLLDADDMYEPECLRTLVSALQDHPDADGIYCGYRFVDHANHLLPQVESRPVAQDALHGALLDGNFLVPESMFLRRGVYDNAGPFDETLGACEDWDMWLRVTRSHTIMHAPQVLTRHRILPCSMSTDPLRMLTFRLAVLKKHVGDEPVGGECSVVHRAYGRAYLGSCVEYLQQRNLDRAYECLYKMADVCPSLLTELDTFYQLGCGEQPKGSMGDLASLSVKRDNVPFLTLLTRLFADAGTGTHVHRLERAASAKAYCALGMLAYGTRAFREARWFFRRAALSDARYLYNRDLVSRWLKSLLSPKVVDVVKEIRQKRAA